MYHNIYSLPYCRLPFRGYLSWGYCPGGLLSGNVSVRMVLTRGLESDKLADVNSPLLKRQNRQTYIDPKSIGPMVIVVLNIREECRCGIPLSNSFKFVNIYCAFEAND